MTLRKIGGSDISALVGCNPYKDSLDVFNRIVLGENEPMNERMARGIREEPKIRGMFVASSGAELLPHPGIIQSEKHEFATISPDDLATLDGATTCCEYKSVNVWTAKKWGDDGTDAVPEHYALQTRWAMAVTGLERAVLFAAFGEDVDANTFDIKFTRLYRFKREIEIEVMLLDAAKLFWETHVVTGVVPERTRIIKKKRTRKGATP